MNREDLFVVVALLAGVFIVSAFRRKPNRCPRCRELNREQALFCAQCGTRLPER